MSFDIRKFVESPKDYLGSLQFAKKNELLTLAAQNKISIPQGSVKKEILCLILDFLVSKHVISEEEFKLVCPKIASAPVESETEKLRLQLALEQARIAAERTRIANLEIENQKKLEFERGLAEVENQKLEVVRQNLDIENQKKLEFERGLAELENRKLEIENQKKLELQREIEESEIRKQRALAEIELEKLARASNIQLETKREEKKLPEVFNMVKAQKLLPVFDEREPDVFFSTFENTAGTLNWPSTEWVLLIRNTFRGKAASISAQMVEERDYEILKRAILDAYSITAEGYRQIFRSSFKGIGQTFLEFCSIKLKQFGKWIEKENVTTFEELKNLILLEEIHRKIPTNISMYIKERQEKDAKKAALLADEYHLIHKTGRVRIPDKQNLEYCSYCRMEGHTIQKCPNPHCKISYNYSSPQQKASYPKRTTTPQPPPAGKVGNLGNHKILHCATKEDSFSSFKCKGKIGDQTVTILRDTGSSQTLISPRLKSLVKETQRYVAVNDLTCQTVLPIVNVAITCPYYTGTAEVAILPKELPCKDIDVLIGNDLAEDKVFQNLIVLSPDIVDEEYVQIMTRAQTSNQIDNPIMETNNDNSILKGKSEISRLLNVDHLTFAEEQQKDETLKILFSKVRDSSDPSNKSPYFYSSNGLLLRHFRSPKLNQQDDWGDQHQLVVPNIYRNLLLEIAHASDSHMGVTKTYQRLSDEFYWTGMKRDVKEFVSTCHTCQVSGKPNQILPKAPLIPVTIPKVPFEKVIIDCVGPFVKSKQGNEYLLTIMCPTTRFPIAIPIRNISAKTIIKHLLHIFSVFGFPKEIQCDRGTNFTSKIFSDTLRLFEIGHILASAYHPESNGALERTHQTIKGLLKKYILDTGKDWDEDLDLLMYVLRSVRNESTNVSPFELLFGRRPRTILTVIREEILQHHEEGEALDVSKYLRNLQEKMQQLHHFAQENLQHTQDKMKHLYDKRSKVRNFSIGDEVLLYHPMPGAPLKEKFQGPYTILKRPSKVNYILKTPDRRKATQLVHVNLLKPYFRSSIHTKTQTATAMNITHNLDYIIKTDLDPENEVTDEIIISWKDATNEEILHSLSDYLQPIEEPRNHQLADLIHKYSDLCTEIPKKCSLGKHDVIISLEAKPIRQSYYRISQERLTILKEEVNYLLDNNLATVSNSPWASPCILVPKANGKFRMCTDYRRVNSVTIKDSFPLPRILDIIDAVSSSPYLTQIDLLKGYYQIELTERAKDISAFITPFGLFSYNVLPFGMCNAPATFQRIMQSTIQGLEGVYVYLDDVVIASNSWEKHLQSLEEVFQRLSNANLTINLAKSKFARATVMYLGHNIGSGKVSPKDSNIKSILDYPTPSDRRSLRTFLGMTSYYSRFCPNYSIITGPLFELTSTKKKFEWTTTHQQIFQQLKSFMTSYPILRAPNFQHRFYLQVDASNYGFGGVLLQDIHPDAGVSLPPFHRLFPISYHSGRFAGAQLRWPTIEKELYSIISSLLHYKIYLEGQKETIVFSDHLPLCFLERAKLTNQKLLRWSYILSASNIRVVRIPGTINTIADAMSRIPSPSSVEKSD